MTLPAGTRPQIGAITADQPAAELRELVPPNPPPVDPLGAAPANPTTETSFGTTFPPGSGISMARTKSTSAAWRRN